MFIVSMLLNKRNKRRKQKIIFENKKRFPSSVVSFSTIYNEKTVLEGENVINDYVNISSAYIGMCSVIGKKNNLSNCKIGRFCSIAEGISIQPWTHPTNFVSSYPGFFETINNYPFGKGETKFNECICCDSGFYVEIGNDVWIGEQVIIKGGVKIGNGAIVGMGAVVTHDVPPYAIVGGVPAKIIKYRFDCKTVEKLLSIKWWEWDIKLIKERRDEFVDTSSFIEKYEK